jgi:hypothetical protein
MMKQQKKGQIYLNEGVTEKRANLKNHIQDAGLARKVI